MQGLKKHFENMGPEVQDFPVCSAYHTKPCQRPSSTAHTQCAVTNSNFQRALNQSSGHGVQEIADTVDLQITGPESELKQLEETFKPFNPTYFYEVQV